MRVGFLLGFLVLFLPAAASTQDIESALTSVVRITGTRNEQPVRGSGFVVAVQGNVATVVTASHVIEGAQFEVVFSGTTARFQVDTILGMESGDRHGLAAFQVRGTIPAGVKALSLDAESRPRYGAPLFLVGFPQRSPVPVVKQGILSTRRGILLLVDRPAGEGASGGPLIGDGKAVGIVTAEDEQFTYAVNAVVVSEALAGWGINPCQPGEEVVVNGIVFVHICPGTFTMGSADDDPLADDNEKPAHRVALSEFWIGKYEVSNVEFRRFDPDHSRDDTLPVINKKWAKGRDFCEYFGFRLPTEAEWEYAARAGSRTAWSFGDEEGGLGRYAWYRARRGQKGVHPVGTKEANAWGLHDMHGNVWEWVADRYGPYSPGPETDPIGPSEGISHVARGGSAWDPPKNMRSAVRDRFNSMYRGYIGFRCVRGPRRQP